MRLAGMPIAAAALAGTVTAGAAKVAPMPGYGVEEIQWHLEVSPGRVELLNGTAQEVIALAKQMNPEFVVPYQTDDPQEATTMIQIQRNRFLCDIFEGMKADRFRIQKGIKHLKGLKGGPTQGPGPSNCGQVSCSHNSAIWICNDAPYTHYFDSWNWIADSAWAIVQTCFVNPDTNGIKIMSDGQVFEDGDWNVIVRGNVCEE
ncbi:hypothetical protein PG996_015727 [Apiospora saccharicola]|uniref:Ecp2 effector protein domain-containing protein n=1 Tax=Apiospora saccharicola TaxID=335842 RepID=A0ABR1TM35_9PEZI